MGPGCKRLARVTFCAFVVFASLARAQTPLGGEFQVNTTTTGNQNPTRSSVAMAANGRFVVVWSGPSDGSDSGIFGQRFDARGRPIGGEFQVNTYTTGRQFGASIAMAPNGRFVVAWAGYGDGGTGSYYTDYYGNSVSKGSYGVWARRFLPNGKPVGSDFQVNSLTTYYQYPPSVAMDPGGNFVVVWRSGFYFDPNDNPDGSGGGIFGRLFSAKGTPRGDDFQVNTYTTDLQYGASVTAASKGSFVVVWTSYPYGGVGGQDGSGGGTFGQRFDKFGAPVGPEFQVNTYTTGTQGQAQVDARPNGDFVVVWRSFHQDGDSAGIFGQRYDKLGTAQGGEFQINSYTTGNQSLASFAVARNGDFVVAWRSYGQDGDNFGVFGRRFTSSGLPGTEFQVNTYTTNIQQNQSIAGRPNGDFVVVWQSGPPPIQPQPPGQDGSGGGVFARRFRRN
jgi:hypothetical protein